MQVIVGLSVIYIIGYNGMVAAYAWLTGGEIPSQRLRSYTFGIASAVGFAGAWLATFTAPYFINPDSLNWGPEYGMIPKNSLINHRFLTDIIPKAGSGALRVSSPLFGSTSTYPRSKIARSKKLTRCLKLGCRRASLGSTFALEGLRLMETIRFPRDVIARKTRPSGKKLSLLRRVVEAS